MPVNGIPTPKNALHYSRWKRVKDGASIEKVAEEDHVKPATIQKSYLMIEERKNLFSMPILETKQVEMIMSLQEEERDSWREAFKAKHRDFHETPNGTVVTEHIDHEVVLSASHAISKRLEALQPRKGFNLNVSNTANAASSSSIPDGKMSFESKLREILQKRQEQKEEPAAIDVPALPSGDDDDAYIDENQA
jgi:hypothetical protein